MQFYKTLAAIRLANRPAFAGDCRIEEKDGLLTIDRGDAIRMVMNFSDRPQKMEGTDLFGEGYAKETVEPNGFVILKI